MAKAGNLTVKIEADTRGFDRAMRRVQFDLWVMQWGWQVLAVAGVAVFALGVLLGVVTS